MNFTRYRVLTHCNHFINITYSKRRNELHPLQGIDTDPTMIVHYRITCRNELHPLQGIDTPNVLPTTIARSLGRNELHPLQGIDTASLMFLIILSLVVEMNFTRYRVLTPTSNGYSYISLSAGRNELHPLQGIDTNKNYT